MKPILLIILTCVSLSALAQKHYVGLKGGLSSTNILSSNFFTESDAKLGLNAGLTYDFIFKDHLTFGAELMYNQRGFKDYLIIFDELGLPTGESFTTQFSYDYVSVPLKIGVHSGNRLSGFANIGIIPSYLVQAKTVVPAFDANGKLLGNDISDVSDRVSNFDFAGLLEIGGAFQVNSSFQIFTALAHQRSLTTITNANYFANSTMKHRATWFSVGVRCGLGN